MPLGGSGLVAEHSSLPAPHGMSPRATSAGVSLLEVAPSCFSAKEPRDAALLSDSASFKSAGDAQVAGMQLGCPRQRGIGMLETMWMTGWGVLCSC